MKLNVLLVSDQVRGIDGTGGLGDVATGLAKALGKRDDIDIRLLTPGYQQISEKGLKSRFDDVVIEALAVPVGERIVSLKVCRLTLPTFSPEEPRITCYLLCEPELLHKRENSGLQAVLLARGAVAFAENCEEFRPDLMHCNDWHTALIPVYLNTLYREHPYLNRIATLYTTHNNTGGAYQGSKSLDEMRPLAGLPNDCYYPGRTHSVEFFGQFNHAKGGIAFSDLVNTVSLTYASELCSVAFGGGLEKVVQERASELCGIVNGIDVSEWDPAHDSFLPAASRFSVADGPTKIRQQKVSLRETLRNWKSPQGATPFANITDDSVLIGVVTRISEQKMPILLPLTDDSGTPTEIPSPVERLCERCRSSERPVQWIFLGNADKSDDRGRRYIAKLNRLVESQPDDVMFFDGFDIGLSHLIYAASELFVVSSSFEPCGLTQLTAMRYGSIPVVRNVGGLRDTVVDELDAFEANGFKFLERDDDVEFWRYQAEVPWAAELLYQTLLRAVDLRANSERWNQLLENGMRRDSSWTIPAAQYRRLYDEAVQQRVRLSFSHPQTAQQLSRQVATAREQFERLIKLPASVYGNLQKFATGRFGAYGLTPVFRGELKLLQDYGYISQGALDQLPAQGDNLSQHLWITHAGMEFVSLRNALLQMIQACQSDA